MADFTKPVPLEDAIRILRIPDDATEYVRQLGHFHQEFPRRHIYGQLHVVPDQLAEFLVIQGLHYLLADGPYRDWETTEDDEDDTEESSEDDGDDDNGSSRDDDSDIGNDDPPPRRRTSRRNR